MRHLFALLCLFPLAAAQGADSASTLAKAIHEAGLDPEHCYRVREINFAKEDLRFYLTDGYLIFGKAVEGRRLSAVFAAETEGGDAEILVMPPHRSERMSLASFTQAPNLNEHFHSAVLLFSDGTAGELLEQITSRETPKAAPEEARLLSDAWTSVVRNLSLSFEVRLVQDLFLSRTEDLGFFYAAIAGKALGNFDLLYDPRAREQIVIGQMVTREERRYFDMWTSFLARSFRKGGKTPPEDPISIGDIAIEATVDPAQSVKAVTRFGLTSEAASDRAVAFQISRRMRVTEAKVDGKPAEVFSRDSLRANLIRGSEDDIFLLVMPAALEQGRTYQIEFTHEGDVVNSSGNGVYFVDSRGSWYPQRRNEFATYDLTFRYPKTLNLVATGSVVEERTEGDWRITRRKTASPVRFAGFNLGAYEKASVTRSGLTVEVYANRQVEAALQPRRSEVVVQQPPAWRRGGRQPAELLTIPMPVIVPNPTARLQTLAGEIMSAMEFMSERFGPPPLKTLTVSPIPGTFGQGFSGLVYLSTLTYLSPRERPAGVRSRASETFFSELLHAHETAHQWWGNLVTSNSYQDNWLMEALANYTALMFLEKKKGRKALDAVLEDYKTNLLAKPAGERTLESAGPIVWGMRLVSSQAPGAYRAITYEKGSWIIHMLRARLGEENFRNFLGELARRYRYKGITTEQFHALAAEFISPKSPDPKLESFFDQWVYGTGIPSLKLNYSVQGKAPRIRIRGTVTQTSVDEDFIALVPVEVQLPGKRSVTKWVRTSSEPVQFSIDSNQPPLKVQLDPANSVLAVRR